jgi:hypothetical protein
VKPADTVEHPQQVKDGDAERDQSGDDYSWSLQ